MLLVIYRVIHIEISLMHILFLLAVVYFLEGVIGETHVFRWLAEWGEGNPDGNHLRRVITCNGSFPWPDISVKKGDRVIVFLTNGLLNSNTSLHFHGLFQEGTNQMDGPEMITQCPISPGDTFVYNFTVNQVGTFWYHSHSGGQYMDGFKGMFVIEDNEFPYAYDEEVFLQISEWYHEESDKLEKKFLSLYNPTGAEPIPQNLIINNTRNLTWRVFPDMTYLVRIVNSGGFVSQYFWIEDHDITVVEVDGIYVEQNVTKMIYLTVAQRASILVRTKSSITKNFAIMQMIDVSMLDNVPDDLQVNGTSFMVYNPNEEFPLPDKTGSIDDCLDDFYLVPTVLYREEALGAPDYQIVLEVIMDNLRDGVNYAFFNNITFTPPKVPPLMTVLSSGGLVFNPLIYGTNTNSFVVGEGETVEIVVNNFDTSRHPFHLHGHAFQLVARGKSAANVTADEYMPYTSDTPIDIPEFPVLRDTVFVDAYSYIVIRFKANNPGVWFFHCHIEWHLLQGLAMVLIEAPDVVQGTPSQQLTENHISVCENVGVMTAGNAAGNVINFLDLTGQNVQQKRIPGGFTTEGIVAFVFSCIAAILGLITIAAYGLMDLKAPEGGELTFDKNEVGTEVKGEDFSALQG